MYFCQDTQVTFLLNWNLKKNITSWNEALAMPILSCSFEWYFSWNYNKLLQLLFSPKFYLIFLLGFLQVLVCITQMWILHSFVTSLIYEQWFHEIADMILAVSTGGSLSSDWDCRKWSKSHRLKHWPQPANFWTFAAAELPVRYSFAC